MDRGGLQPRSHLALLPFRVRRGGALRRRGGAPLRRCNGSRNAVASALKRFKADGMIRQLARGLYDYPVHDSVLGTVTPSADAIARALVVRDAIRLQPSGAYAANVMWLSEQVPFKTHPERLWTRDVASPQHSKSASFPNPPHPVFGWLCWTGPVVFNPEAVGSL